MTKEYNWDPPLFDPEDQRLVDAYARVGRPLDYLAYTPEFVELCRLAERPTDELALHNAYRRLLGLRKQGRLPRLFATLAD